MTADLEKKLKTFAALLRRQNVPLERMFLFGSAARGTMHTWSDIDVGVVGRTFGKDRIEEMVLLRRIAEQVDVAISPIPLRPEDLDDRFGTIADAIRREGQEVYTNEPST